MVVTSACVPRPYRLWGRGGEFQGNPIGGGGGKNATFSWREPRGAFGQLVFFLAVNRMTTVAFESLACLAKPFSSTELRFRA